MIVKNESKIIERCLDSVKDIVDCISICDTGSTDDTVEIIQKYLKREGIPGKVHHHGWQNFGYNRTLSAIAAQEFLEEVGFLPEETLLLLLDADMMLEVGSEFDKDSLTADHYLLIQTNHSYKYYNTRLIRASLPWICVGATHEYWACKSFNVEARLNTLSIDDRDDGGSKADKFERDIRLLSQDLEEHPNNSRSVFYMATSYHCLNQYEEAIKWYKKYISMGGWYEEVWYSKYMIGTCYETMGDWDQALHWYLDAFQSNPGRAEPLHHIAKFYRLNEQYDLSFLFANEGSTIPYPHEQHLFVSYPVYDYLFDEELSINSFYTSHKDEGYAAVNRLMLKNDIPYYVREQAFHNMLHYVKPLENAYFQPILFDLPLIREGLGVHYNPMNPSIIKTEDGYDVICRTVNYMQIGAKHFQTLDVLDPLNTIKTRNFLLEYDKDFNLLSQQEIVEDLPRYRYQSRNIEGLEDCRMFEFDGSLWFTCTTLDTNPSGQPQISLGKIEDDRSGSSVRVESLIPLFAKDPTRCEKNWLPFVKDDAIHLIYSYDPFIVYKPNLDGSYVFVNEGSEAVRYSPKQNLTRFSGSASPIAFDDGYLLLIHETVYEDHRTYLQRFVYLDKDLKIKKVSKPFIYLHKGIEYCCGIAIDHSETQLIMTVGLEDREAFLCTVDLDTVRSMLEDL
jgi:glycosyltransferase involved in cell wall biosynthesis